MRFLVMAPLWLVSKFCLLALRLFSTACLLPDLVPAADLPGLLRHRGRKAG